MRNSIRVAVHVHSSWSYDGNWSLHDVASLFSSLGFHAVLMAEHDRTFDEEMWREYVAACAAASSTSVTLVPGIEHSDAEDLVHVLTWGANEFLGSSRPTHELLLSAHAAGAITVFAHPARREAWRRFDPDWLPLLSGVEVWNGRYGSFPAGASPFADSAGSVPPFYGIDFHSGRDIQRAGMRVMLDGLVSANAIIAAFSTQRATPEMRTRGLSRHLFRSRRGSQRLINRSLRRTGP
jgi:predicted metal-dependent phosphoesterase TrpH